MNGLDIQAPLTLSDGRLVDLLNPRPEDISLVQMAHPLAQAARFGRQAPMPYSVAQHMVLASQIAPAGFERWCFLHDAAEAFLNDIPAPLKHTSLFRGYRNLEDTWLRVIVTKYGLSWPEPPEVRIVDRRLLQTEKQLVHRAAHNRMVDSVEPYPMTIVPWSMEQARHAFIDRAQELFPEAFAWEEHAA